MLSNNEVGKFAKSEIAKFIDGAQIANANEQVLKKVKEPRILSGEEAKPQALDSATGRTSVFSDYVGMMSAILSTFSSRSGGLNFATGGDSGGAKSPRKGKSVEEGVAGSGEKRPGNKKKDDPYISLQSSNLEAVRYDSQTKTLYVKFLSGREYEYDQVPKSKFDNLINWSSHGSYLYWNIRGRGRVPTSPPYKYKRIK